MRAPLRACLVIATIAGVAPGLATAQGRTGGPVTITQAQPGLTLALPIDIDPVVKDAPYSADAVTTVTQVLGDGTKIEQSVTAKIYRDGMGRVRREQTVLGLAALTPGQPEQRTITITDPVEGVAIALDERTRTARRNRWVAPGTRFFRTGAALTSTPFGLALDTSRVYALRLRASDLPVNTDQLAGLIGQLQGGRTGGGGRGAAPAPAGPATSLGSRTIEGVLVTGKRTTQTIPTGQIGNDRPIVISDEVWESDALKAVVISKHTDPRTGTVDYKLTNIRLGEPAADLFTVPQGYTITGPPPAPALPTPPGLGPASPASPNGPPSPAPGIGGRSGGGRGRGAQQ